MNRAITWLWRSLLITAAYAVLRYNVLGDVAWQHVPLFVGNKALAWTAVVMLAVSYLWRDKDAARAAGCLGVMLAAGHLVISVVLLGQHYFPRLDREGRLSFSAELSLLAAILASLLLVLPAVASIPSVRESIGDLQWRRWQRAGYAVLALSAVHTATLGFEGWIRPHTWPGGLPPITLLTTLVAAAPLMRRVFRPQAEGIRTRSQSSPTGAESG